MSGKSTVKPKYPTKAPRAASAKSAPGKPLAASTAKVVPAVKASVTSFKKSPTMQTGVITMPTKSTAYKRIEASFEPMMDLNKMLTGSMENSYNKMMDSFQGYSKLSIDNMQSALKIRNPQDMMSFMESQNLMANKASEMVMSDAKDMSEMSIKFFNDLRSMYESGMKTSMTSVTEAMKAA